MRKYTIHCTAEQTKKALELGAPLFTFGESFADDYRTSIYDKYCSIPPIKEEEYEDDVYADIPTAEQMIGWLEEQKEIISIEITELDGIWQGFVTTINYKDAICINDCETRKDATLAAIDAALDYLIKNKNHE